MSEYNPRRMILKFFKCPSCQKDFKNLVLAQEKFSKCPNCLYEQCSEIIEIETKSERENINNNKNINTSNENSTKNNSNNIIEGNRGQRIRIVVYEGTIRNGMPSNDKDDIFNFFNENPIDNLLPNLLGLSDSVVIINRVPFQNEENFPVEKNIINKLNHFKMEKKLCKENEQGKIEFPKCTVCLMEINEGMDSISLPCEHIFHDNCIIQWFEIHNTCPLCRLELSSKQFENKNGVNQNNSDSNQNINNLYNGLNNNTTFEDVN